MEINTLVASTYIVCVKQQCQALFYMLDLLKSFQSSKLTYEKSAISLLF